jgi:hypothetical protein
VRPWLRHLMLRGARQSLSPIGVIVAATETAKRGRATEIASCPRSCLFGRVPQRGGDLRSETARVRQALRCGRRRPPPASAFVVPRPQALRFPPVCDGLSVGEDGRHVFIAGSIRQGSSLKAAAIPERPRFPPPRSSTSHAPPLSSIEAVLDRLVERRKQNENASPRKRRLHFPGLTLETDRRALAQHLRRSTRIPERERTTSVRPPGRFYIPPSSFKSRGTPRKAAPIRTEPDPTAC